MVVLGMVLSTDNEETCKNRRVRTILSKDVPVVAEFIKQSGPVTEEFARSLPPLLQQLISDEMLNGVAVEYVHGDGTPPEPAAFGLSAFITEEWVASYIASPSPHLGLLLMHQALLGLEASPFLTLQEVAYANANGGLTLVPLFWLQRSYDQTDPEAYALMVIAQQTLLRRHRGYRLNRILKEVPAQLASAFFGGGFEELCHFPADTPLHFRPDTVLDQDSIVFTISKEGVQGEWPGRAIALLFAHQPPRCAFTYAEQQVLMRAADGLTDAKIAQDIGITVTAVSLRWRSIYNRITEHAPFVLQAEECSDGVRGQEKRRLVIAFVNEHPEELRPYSKDARRRSRAIE